MRFLKLIGLVLFALVLGAMAMAALPFLYLLGVGFAIILTGYFIHILKDFDPDDHFPFDNDK